MKKIVLLCALVLVGGISAYYFVSYRAVQSTFVSDNLSNELQFETETWATGTTRQRGRMVNYLLDSIGLVDKSKTEIENLLGVPDSKNSVVDGEYTSTFYYTVDKGHAFTYDMILFFDSTDHVKFVLLDD
jgi:hypothetical protein